MALTTCPDCGKQISTAAATCVGCGRPMRETKTEMLQKLQLLRADYQQAEAERDYAGESCGSYEMRRIDDLIMTLEKKIKYYDEGPDAWETHRS